MSDAQARAIQALSEAQRAILDVLKSSNKLTTMLDLRLRRVEAMLSGQHEVAAEVSKKLCEITGLEKLGP